MVCARADDQGAVWDTSMTVAVQRLPWHRPLWRLTAITGSEDTPVALVVVFHHVLADGIGGLAVLARLVDGAALPHWVSTPGPTPLPHLFIPPQVCPGWAVCHSAAHRQPQRGPPPHAPPTPPPPLPSSIPSPPPLTS